MSDSEVSDFRAAIDDSALLDLRQRISSTRWPDPETVADWSQGMPIAYARELADYWCEGYDWRRAEQTLNQWPQALVQLPMEGDDYRIHCIHRRSPEPGARPLLITHGWPGSVFEFYKIIDALADPRAHGGNPQDAFHVVAPSLPGYGFSSKPVRPGTSIERVADLWNALMRALGYPRYFAQGGDWGSMVTGALALRHADNCAGIHLNMVVALPDPGTRSTPSDLEQRAAAARDRYAMWDSGYSKQQSTRPQTLGYALADSPVGQMAWIVEKFWSWTDCERDGVRHPEHAVSRDEMLDNVSLYWLSNSAASAARLYWESFNKPDLSPVAVPMGGSLFPHDIFLSSERWAKGRFPELVYWNELDRGGHFAALEQPALFTDEMRNCFRRMSL